MITIPHKPTLTERVVDTSIKGLTGLLFRVDAKPLEQLPAYGPLIIVTNHVNFFEAPILYTRLQPRPLTGFAKIETWDSKFLGWLFDLWEMIPVRRGEADMKAVKQGIKALKNGYIFTIAPEGTRSYTGELGRGHPGVVMMAQLSGAPIVPLVHYGHENYKKEIPRLHRPKFNPIVGRKFWLDSGGEKVTGEIRQKMADEIMYQLAALLPPAYRGVYADLSQASEHYLTFPPGTTSNLRQVKEKIAR